MKILKNHLGKKGMVGEHVVNLSLKVHSSEKKEFCTQLFAMFMEKENLSSLFHFEQLWDLPIWIPWSDIEHSKFWSISLDQKVEHKTLSSEEWVATCYNFEIDDYVKSTCSLHFTTCSLCSIHDSE